MDNTQLKNIIKEWILEEMEARQSQQVSPKDVITAYTTWLGETIEAANGNFEPVVLQSIILKSENFVSALKRVS